MITNGKVYNCKDTSINAISQLSKEKLMWIKYELLQSVESGQNLSSMSLKSTTIGRLSLHLDMLLQIGGIKSFVASSELAESHVVISCLFTIVISLIL